MAPETLTTRILQQGLSNQVRPLDAPSLPWRNPAIVKAAERSTVRVEQTLANSVANRARPFPFTAASRAEAAFTTNRINASAARVAAAQLAEKQAGAALGKQFLVFRTRSAVGAFLQPAVRASAAVGGALMRVPVVGTVIRRLAPFVPKGPALGVLLALQVVPSIFEAFAPDVKSWLLGGWSQSGRKANQLPPGVGQSAVLYNVVCEVELYDPDTARWVRFGTGTDTVSNVLGPIESVLGPHESGGGSFVTVRSANGQQVSFGQTSYGSAGTYRLASIRALRVDGIREGDGSGSFTSGASAPKQTGIASNPAQTNNAKNARDAGIAAVAVTIAAGKFKLPPKLKAPPTQIPARKVGLLPSASPTSPPPPSQPCKGNSCGQAGLDQAKKNGEDLQKILDALSLLGIGDIKKTVDRIDTKIGPQAYDAVGNKRGLTEMAIDTVKGVGRIKDYLPIDRMLNTLTLAMTIHNAAMLSNSLEQTVASTVSNVLAALGIHDTEGNPLDINKILSTNISGFLKSILGEENYTSLVATWKKGNRIYQASANLLSNVNSLRYSFTSALEQIGGMNGKIGNALRRSGAVSENSYPWFNPSPNYDNRFMRGLETAEQFTSSIDSIAGEILSAQDSIKQIGDQKTELEKAVKEGTEKATPENDQQKAKAAVSKDVSKSPNIEATDLAKPGGT